MSNTNNDYPKDFSFNGVTFSERNKLFFKVNELIEKCKVSIRKQHPTKTEDEVETLAVKWAFGRLFPSKDYKPKEVKPKTSKTNSPLLSLAAVLENHAR